MIWYPPACRFICQKMETGLWYQHRDLCYSFSHSAFDIAPEHPEIVEHAARYMAAAHTASDEWPLSYEKQ